MLPFSIMAQSKPKFSVHRSFKLDPDLSARLDDVSRANRVGASTVVRIALINLIAADMRIAKAPAALTQE